MLLQNPVNTMAWSIVQLQLLGPLVVLVRECGPFTMPPLRFKPLVLLMSLWSLLLTAVVLAGPPDHANLFHLYIYPCTFRWRFELFALGSIIPYTVLLRLVRYLIFRHEGRRILAVTHSMSQTQQPCKEAEVFAEHT